MKSDASEPSIPTVDLADLFSHDRSTRTNAASSIADGFSSTGLVFVTGHGVDLELEARVLERFVALTRRSPEEKERLHRPELWSQRGWTPSAHGAPEAGRPEQGERFLAAPMPLDPDCRVEHPQMFAENVWPDDGGDELQDDVLALGQQLHEAALSLLSGLSIALGLPPRGFDQRVDGAAHVLALLRHRALNAEQLGDELEERADRFDLLRLSSGGRLLDAAGQLCAAPSGGTDLSLRTRPSAEHPRGRIARATAPREHIVAEVGQALEILTGGKVRATPCVFDATQEHGVTRVSATHGLHLHPHQMVFPFEKYRTPETLRTYRPPVLAGTYAMKSLIDLGLAPASALDALGYRPYARLASNRDEEPTSP